MASNLIYSSHISANDDATNVLMCPHRSTTMQYKKRKLAILLITILLNKTLVPSNLRARMYVKEEFEDTDRFREWAQQR